MTINESIYMALSVSDASGVAPLLMGNPGAGKTTSVEFFAKANNMKMVLLRGSQSSPEEILGYEVNDGDEEVRGNLKVKKASKICPKWYDELLENHEKGVRTLLFLDEITTASSFVQAALLQVIFGREIDNGYRLPDDTFVVAAGNYAGNLSSDFNLIPPLMNRFCIFNVSITKDDIKAFMSKYRDRQDIISKLKEFDLANATDIKDLDSGFIDSVKKTMEMKICDLTCSLIAQNKFDPNITEMSDIYQDQTLGTKLLGFLTPRTMNYYRDTAIHMYLRYGVDGVKSDTFREMTQGLVGISLSSGGNSKNKSGIRKEDVASEFVKVVEQTAIQLDKKRISSIASTEKEIERLITKLDTNGQKVEINILPSSDLIALGKIFENSIKDKDMRKSQTPIDPKTILDCENVIINSARNVMNSDKEVIMSIVNASRTSGKIAESDRGKINIEKINGNIKTYNDSIKAYKKLSEFIKIKEFGYSDNVINKITIEDKEIIFGDELTGEALFKLDTELKAAVIFFFKQKTAYEVLYGDWSSDVCSSDLSSTPAAFVARTMINWFKIGRAHV